MNVNEKQIIDFTLQVLIPLVLTIITQKFSMMFTFLRLSLINHNVNVFHNNRHIEKIWKQRAFISIWAWNTIWKNVYNKEFVCPSNSLLFFFLRQGQKKKNSKLLLLRSKKNPLSKRIEKWRQRNKNESFMIIFIAAIEDLFWQ